MPYEKGAHHIINSKDSDQPVHLHILIRISAIFFINFSVRRLKMWQHLLSQDFYLLIITSMVSNSRACQYTQKDTI